MARKNARIRKADVDVEMTYDQVMELKRCATDPVYFCQNYVRIQHPVRGSIPFELYDYQERMIRDFQNNRFSIVLSSRQTGKSICSAAYLMWYAMFHFDKTILIASNKNSNAMEMIHRMKYLYEQLPTWIKPGITDDGWNKHTLGFDNNSRILSEATSENSGRGLSISLVFLDEFAFVAPAVQSEFWTSMAPTLSTGGSCIIASTPNGDSDIFATLWRGALAGNNGFTPQRVEWNAPPGRDEKFKREEIGRIGQLKWSQEYECEFLSSDALLIDSIVLANLSTELARVEPLTTNNGVVFWDTIKPGETYLIGVDPATGASEDYTVMTGFSFPAMVQVFEYRSNTVNTNELYSILKNLLLYITRNKCEVFFTIENNGIGEGLISLYREDENIPESAEFISEGITETKLGVTTTVKTKMKTCVSFKSMLESGGITIKSPDLLSELKTYVRSRGSYNAQRGSTDDSISAVLVVIRIVTLIATYEQSAYQILYDSDFNEWSKESWDVMGGSDDNADDVDNIDPFIV